MIMRLHLSFAYAIVFLRVDHLMLIETNNQDNTICRNERKKKNIEDYGINLRSILQHFLEAEPCEGLKYGRIFLLPSRWYHPRAVFRRERHGERVVKLPASIPVTDSQGNPYRTSVIAFSCSVFVRDTDVEEIILPGTISSIPQGAFAGCSSLKRITIPKRVTSILRATFEGCTSLTDVYYEGSEEEWAKVKIFHKGYRVTNPKALGAVLNVEEYEITGNEPILQAKVHFNCTLENAEIRFSVTVKGKDSTKLLQTDVQNTGEES